MEGDKKIGIALSGGGLQGFAHIGALRALEELGINNIKYISGTSTGSIAASLYAMGFDTYEMEKICAENYKELLKMKKRTFLKIGFNYILSRRTKTEGLIDGEVIENFIHKQAAKKSIKSINDIKNRKLAIATVDTKSIKECIFISDKLENKTENVNYIQGIEIGKAVRASMAFPGIFTTANYKEYNFIDGGTVDNLPTKVLKDMGAEKIISIGFDVTKYKPSDCLEDVLLRALDVYSYQDVKTAEELADVAIEIYNADTSLLKVDDIKATVKNGYDSVMAHKEEIKNIIQHEKI